MVGVSIPQSLSAQKRTARTVVREVQPSGMQIIDGDTVCVYAIAPVLVFEKGRDLRRYERLVRNVKKVYPYAKEASEYMNTMEADLAKLKTAREREKYARKLEKEIVKKYTPVLKQMTISQGKILIKLIDRETDRTAHGILKEFRGNLTAGFWNGIAKIFKADLKQEYDKDGEDAMIEQIIILYEAGLL